MAPFVTKLPDAASVQVGELNLQNVAWISAHGGTSDDGPKMPLLEAKLYPAQFLPAGAAPPTKVRWRLQVTYQRPKNGGGFYPYTEEDFVLIPCPLKPGALKTLPPVEKVTDVKDDFLKALNAGGGAKAAILFIQMKSSDPGQKNYWKELPPDVAWKPNEEPAWSGADGEIAQRGLFGGKATVFCQALIFIPAPPLPIPVPSPPAISCRSGRPPPTSIRCESPTSLTFRPVRAGSIWLRSWIFCLRFAPPFGQPVSLRSAHPTHPSLGRRPAHARRARDRGAPARSFHRSGQSLDGLIAHSDRGSQYTSAAWQRNLRLLRMTSDMSRAANCYDNAPMKSFLATLKAEAFRAIPATRQEARFLLHDFIDDSYNTCCIHSSLTFQSPIIFERAIPKHLN